MTTDSLTSLRKNQLNVVVRIQHLAQGPKCQSPFLQPRRAQLAACSQPGSYTVIQFSVCKIVIPEYDKHTISMSNLAYIAAHMKTGLTSTEQVYAQSLFWLNLLGAQCVHECCNNCTCLELYPYASTLQLKLIAPAGRIQGNMVFKSRSISSSHQETLTNFSRIIELPHCVMHLMQGVVPLEA